MVDGETTHASCSVDDVMDSCEEQREGEASPPVRLLSLTIRDTIFDTAAGRSTVREDCILHTTPVRDVDPQVFELAGGKHIKLHTMAEALEIDGERHDCYVIDEGPNLAAGGECCEQKGYTAIWCGFGNLSSLLRNCAQH